MERNRAPFAACIAAALVSFTGQAFGADTGPDQAVIGQIAASQGDRILYLSQAATEKAKKDLDDSRTATSGLPLAENSAAPALLRITAANNVPRGKFLYPGNVQIEAGLGEKIPGGYTVVNLWSDKLSGELKDAQGHIVPIGMSSAPSDTATTQQASAAPGVTYAPMTRMPPLPQRR